LTEPVRTVRERKYLVHEEEVIGVLMPALGYMDNI